MILDEWSDDIVSKESMKSEALERMEELQLHNSIINTFKNSDKLLCSNHEKIVEVPPRIRKEIREWEERYGCMAYHVVFSRIYGYEIFNALSVSCYQEDWKYERALIDCNCSMAYTINMTKPDYSESGSIMLLNVYGTLKRIR